MDFIYTMNLFFTKDPVYWQGFKLFEITLSTEGVS